MCHSFFCGRERGREINPKEKQEKPECQPDEIPQPKSRRNISAGTDVVWQRVLPGRWHTFQSKAGCYWPPLLIVVFFTGPGMPFYQEHHDGGNEPLSEKKSRMSDTWLSGCPAVPIFKCLQIVFHFTGPRSVTILPFVSICYISGAQHFWLFLCEPPLPISLLLWDYIFITVLMCNLCRKDHSQR